MKKIVIAAQPYDRHTAALVSLLETLFPECEVQVSLVQERNAPDGTETDPFNIRV